MTTAKSGNARSMAERFIHVLRREVKQMMKWEAESKGYTCNDCFLSMQNCHDKSICCEDETGLCDYFEEIPKAKEEGEEE